MAKRFVRVFIRAIFHVISYIWRPLIKMEILRKERGIARRLFTTAKNEFEANLESTNIDEITAAFNKLQLRADSLFNVDLRIKEQWLKTDEMTEDEIYEDCMTSDKYLSDWERIKVMYENVSRKNERMKRFCKSSGSDVSNNTQKSHQCCEKSACNSACHSRRFRLPKFELRKFDGNTKNWIGFWCQFQKIDDDETIDDGDKFQYLYQCTVPDTPAREIVESFPPSGDNYKKAVEQLKSRFARDEMLIDIYVRELLNLVLAQAKVESALPESVLRAWQRSHVLEEKGDDHLNQLMQFLKREVESEERIQLARTGIASGDSLHSVSTQPTAACLVSTEDAENLDLKPVGKEIVSNCLFGGIETKKELFHTYELKLASLDKKFECTMTARDKSTLCGYVPRLNVDHEMIKELQKHNITLSDVGDAAAPDIGLLIGADHAGALLTESFVNLNNNLVAIKTKFGWTLQGPIMNACSVLTNVVLVNFQLSELWDLETLGIRDPVEVANKAKTDTIILDQFRESIKINDEGRYEVDLPWKPHRGELLDNKHLAEKRLMSTTQKLLKLNEFDNYGQVFEDWLKEGIIEEVGDTSKPKHYLCHHAVIKNTNLTTRVRPVFDASARDYNGNSLNSFLEKGLNCLELIPKLLIKFRKHAIGITSDIKKAFLQISLKKEDRQYLSFLWWRNNERKAFTTYRHCRVVFGVTCSPFLLGATLNYHLEKYTEDFKDTAKLLKDSFYVDNCVTSLESEDEAKTFIEEAKRVMSDAKFDLRGWVTTPMAKYMETNSLEDKLSVLGLMWDVNMDQLHCNVSFAHSTALMENVTKRSLLSITQKVFDPVGFACPVTLVPKLILQKTWNLRLSWDSELPDDLQKEFFDWSKHIHLLNECRIPRRLTCKPINKCDNSLHVFSDASKVSFATAIFLRSDCEGEVTVQLVQARSRVLPIREVSIPRAELMGALIATRLYLQVKEALDLSNCRVFFWTDASVAFTWITSEGDWNIFVKNRVKEIRQHTNVENWRHLPGLLNPADLPSRGCNARQLLKSKWWEGPAWLKAKESEWPKSQLNVDEQEVNKEARKVVLANNTTDHSTFLSTLTYFSKYTMIVRMVGWILRFSYNCKNTHNKKSGELTCEEFQCAEKRLLKIVQAEMIAEVDPKKMKDLKIFKDEEGLMRIRTKLVLSDEPADFVCPIYIPGKHFIIQRLVASKHRLMYHAGPAILMAALRETYWITGIRRLVSSTVSKCIPCKRLSVKHADTPLPPLPRDRIKRAAAFEVTGIDLAGPLFLRSGGKVWIILFTCAVYRAVHLELTKSLTTEAFLMALRRFIARRGRVDTIYTDNGTNFHGADNLLKSLDWQEIAAYSSVRNIKWKFSPPAAPWWGGWWERLIRSLKDLLRRNLGQKTLTYEELMTLMQDCEALINSRPLTYIADNSDKLKPITPACFTQGLPSSEVPDLDQLDRDSLNRRLRYLHKLREDLRERFQKRVHGDAHPEGQGEGLIFKGR
ncbi:uncharacterized protein LOC133518592 [Cydia pomonella]|uniref:uncharacterized protein LOC133518592 n=1 Tax=Cydia pomonella TaxID=82600 RepID=UPI002ADD5395|nr:uncharacterized protein LOC133518592 [Cydia pomonella]